MEPEILREPITCGEAVTTIYRDEAGTIIRQDCVITVTNPPTLVADAGKV